MGFKHLAAAGTLLAGFSSAATAAPEDTSCLSDSAPSAIASITQVRAADADQNPIEFVAFKTCDGETRHISVEDLIKASTDGKVPIYHHPVKIQIPFEPVKIQVEPGMQ